MEGEGSDEFGGERHGGGRYGGDRHGGDREGVRIKSSYFLPKPVKVGDEVDVKIEAVASKGDGIAKKDGFVIFVKGAKEGDQIKVRIVDVKARFAVGEIVQ
jgi:predicted RNA-binding protein with TRAM domain